MDQTYLLALVIAMIVVLVTLVSIRGRIQRDDAESTTIDSQFATSTEGEKVCPRCGMGNLWTDRKCIGCGGALKG